MNMEILFMVIQTHECTRELSRKAKYILNILAAAVFTHIYFSNPDGK